MKTQTTGLFQRLMQMFCVFALLCTLGGFSPHTAYAADTSADTSTSTTTGDTSAGGIFNNMTVDGTTGNVTMGSAVTSNNYGAVTTKAQNLAIWVSGILSIIMLMCLLLQIAKLGSAGDNEMARKKATMGILTTGIALALFGGSTIVVGFFWNLITGV